MVVINFPSAPKTTIFLKARFPKLLGKVPTSVYYKWHPFKARVYNPGELASELARFESGISSKFHPSPSRQCSVQSHAPTNLNVHLAVGLSREKEMLEHYAAIQLNSALSRQEVKC